MGNERSKGVTPPELTSLHAPLPFPVSLGIMGHQRMCHLGLRQIKPGVCPLSLSPPAMVTQKTPR